MSDVMTVRLEEGRKAPRSRGRSLMTPLGVVEGEILEYLGRHRITTLRQLNRALAAPSYLVMMAVGALIRAGLVRGVQEHLALWL